MVVLVVEALAVVHQVVLVVASAVADFLVEVPAEAGSSKLNSQSLSFRRRGISYKVGLL